MLLFTMVFSLVALAQSPDMEARGTLNGCQDGKSVASNSDWYLTLNSIMNNQSIDLNYRVAYYEAFMSCRRIGFREKKIMEVCPIGFTSTTIQVINMNFTQMWSKWL